MTILSWELRIAAQIFYFLGTEKKRFREEATNDHCFEYTDHVFRIDRYKLPLLPDLLVLISSAHRETV